MPVTSVLIANRGEIAIRIARAAAELGIRSVAVAAEDDVDSLHVRRADASAVLAGRGPRAYLDAEQLVAVALAQGCDAVHPGYGFLSEDAAFAGRCAEAGLQFVGPRPEILALFGDKAAGRALAARCGVATLQGTEGPATLEDAADLLASLGEGGAVMVKAIAGGGGRGMRVVLHPDELAAAWERCASEARAAFGRDELYVERYLPRARHLEVQVVGDGRGGVVHLGERECSVQRRHQKLVEVAPAPNLSPFVRERLAAAAVRMAEQVHYDNLGTFEFLLDAGAADPDEAPIVFIEANARLQVEHTVTEEVTGTDLVQVQLALAGGATLAELGLAPHRVPTPRGFAIQARVNLETVTPDGMVRPSGGTLQVFEMPAGPGVRVDTFGRAGYTTSPAFDPLLAKVVVRTASEDFAAAAARAARAIGELRVEGVRTNAELLQRILRHPRFVAGAVDTRFLDEHLAELVPPPPPPPPPAGPVDPLAVLTHATAPAAPPVPAGAPPVPPGTDPVCAPLQGTVASLAVTEGDAVPAGTTIAVLEAMKMEHEVTAARSGIVRAVLASVGDTVGEGHPLVAIEAAEVAGGAGHDRDELDLDHIRPDLAEVVARHDVGLDEHRPEAVARRHARGRRTARENVADLVDPGSLVEYAPLVVAAQRKRRTLEDLIARTPADGMIGGLATVNADRFGPDAARCAVMSYDYTVLAGTQGSQNHRKKDRLFELAERWRLPVVFFTEGGGGRPGDTDGLGVAGLDCMAFHLFGRLSGLVPLVGITAGPCFAGNAAILGCCDVVIATRDSTIGMGGPAMIEGGGLGVYRPEEVGPIDVMVANGVVDVAVEDEAEAVRVAKQYLSYFQGPLEQWSCADQRRLRHLVPENRVRVYDVRSVIETLADDDSVLELRRGFGHGMVTALARVEGKPLGIVANDPRHLGGAIDPEAADKSARFLQLCDAFDLPVVFLCDTPGFMVGPEIEKQAMVRKAARLFVVGANLDVPFMTIVLRKGYGLGAQGMAGGGFKVPMFTVAWPSGEFGGMGLEGAVKLGYRNELAAIEDLEERQRAYGEMVERMYQHGKALSMATAFEIDEVIDPAESRRWIAAALRAAGPRPPRHRKKRPNVDSW